MENISNLIASQSIYIYFWCPLRFLHKTMFDSPLPSVVCRRDHVLFMLNVFARVEWWQICYPFVCLYVPWCDVMSATISSYNIVYFPLLSSCLYEGSCLIYVICVCWRIVVSNTSWLYELHSGSLIRGRDGIFLYDFCYKALFFNKRSDVYENSTTIQSKVISLLLRFNLCKSNFTN